MTALELAGARLFVERLRLEWLAGRMPLAEQRRYGNAFRRMD